MLNYWNMILPRTFIYFCDSSVESLMLEIQDAWRGMKIVQISCHTVVKLSCFSIC